MAVKKLSQDDVVQLLQRAQGDLTQKDFALKLGVSQQYLSDVLLGRRDPGPSILEFLGIEKAYVQNSSKSNAAD